jgi:hypothetical protein
LIYLLKRSCIWNIRANAALTKALVLTQNQHFGSIRSFEEDRPYMLPSLNFMRKKLVKSGKCYLHELSYTLPALDVFHRSQRFV